MTNRKLHTRYRLDCPERLFRTLFQNRLHAYFGAIYENFNKIDSYYQMQRCIAPGPSYPMGPMGPGPGPRAPEGPRATNVYFLLRRHK